jgi:hypothetical protein
MQKEWYTATKPDRASSVSFSLSYSEEQSKEVLRSSYMCTSRQQSHQYTEKGKINPGNGGVTSCVGYTVLTR